MLEILFEFRKGILFVRMNGEVSKRTYLKYNNEVISMIKQNGIRNVVLNLENVYYVDLKGINTLFYTYELVRDNKGHLMISNINKLIEKSLLKSHLLKYVNVLQYEIDSFEKVIV